MIKAKRLLAMLVCVAMTLAFVPCIGVFAADIVESGTCGENVTWTLDSEGTLIISGTGKMTDYDWGESPFCDRTDIKTVVIEEGVTSIYDYAFSSCSSLTSINIPIGVTYIGEEAFCNCSSLTSVTIPDSVTRVIIHTEN